MMHCPPFVSLVIDTVRFHEQNQCYKEHDPAAEQGLCRSVDEPPLSAAYSLGSLHHHYVHPLEIITLNIGHAWSIGLTLPVLYGHRTPHS